MTYRWMKTPGYKEVFEGSRIEFELARQLIETRIKNQVCSGHKRPNSDRVQTHPCQHATDRDGISKVVFIRRDDCTQPDDCTRLSRPSELER